MRLAIIIGLVSINLIDGLVLIGLVAALLYFARRPHKSDKGFWRSRASSPFVSDIAKTQTDISTIKSDQSVRDYKTKNRL